jgi:hypothetical protein
MTTIAYRDGILACDSCWSDDSLVVLSQTKILRLRSGALYGAAGHVDDRALVAALQDASGPADLPSHEDLYEMKTEIRALLIFPDGSVFMIDAKEPCAGVTPLGPFAAVGSGGRVAMGAMAMGASAEQAVEIACRLDTYCRLPIHTLALKTDLSYAQGPINRRRGTRNQKSGPQKTR